MIKDDLKNLSEDIFFENEEGAITPQEHRRFYQELIDNVVMMDEFPEIALTGVASDVLPQNDRSQNLGSKKKAWNNVFVGAIHSSEMETEIKLGSSLIPSGDTQTIGKELNRLTGIRSKIIYTIITILFFSMSICGQSRYKFPTLIPNSPNAASLGQYGMYPVGHYTGTANINVPIYNIEFEGKTIPISLSYHTSGIKLDQEASWVGLGWSLSAGGCITKDIRGIDDFYINGDTKGYFYNTNFPHYDSNNNPDPNYIQQETTLYNRFYMGILDSEPDYYHFNFAGLTGTLFFEKQPNVNEMIPKAIQKSKDFYIDASYDIRNKLWIIKDGDGFSYYFGTCETTKTYSKTYGSYVENADPTRMWDDIINNETAWMLDSIVAPNNKKIIFSYEFEEIRTPINIKESTSRLYEQTRLSGTGTSTFAKEYMYYLYTVSDITQARLKEIKWNAQSISFNSSDREDLKGLNNKKAKKLDQININSEISYYFDYSYQGDQTDPFTCRLMLDCFRVNFAGHSVFKYDFYYNDEYDLPAKNSYETDLWGYFNGKKPVKPERISPVEEYHFYLSPTSVAFPSNGSVSIYRGKDIHPDKGLMKTGVLSKIKYPTGAELILEYSPHTFNETLTTTTYGEEIILGAVGSGRPGNTLPYSDSQPFVIPTSRDVYIHAGWNLFDRTAPPAIFIVELYKVDNNNNLSFYRLCGSFGGKETGWFRQEPFKIDAGKYVIRLLDYPSPDEWRMSARLCELSYKNHDFDYGGGLKVDKMTVKDKNMNVQEKTFKYVNNGIATGKLMRSPMFYRLADMRVDIAGQGSFLGHFLETGTEFLTSSGSAQGNAVGYSYVEEINADGSNGKIAYYFHNEKDRIILDSYPGFPTIKDINNGLLKKIEYYDKDQTIIKTVINEYETKKTKKLKGLQTMKSPVQYQKSYAGYPVKFYDIDQETTFLTSTITTDFLNQSLSVSESYKYNDYGLPVENIKYNKSGILAKNRIKYPSNYNESIYQEMVTNHLVNIPVEVIQMKDDANIVSAHKTSFKKFSNNLFLPEKEYQLNTTKLLKENNYLGYYEPVIEYKKYNSYGKIEHIRFKESDIIYLWSFYGSHPIAEIRNASYEDVESAAKQIFEVQNLYELASLKYVLDSPLMKLRTHEKLKNSHVKTLRFDHNGLLIRDFGISGYDQSYEYNFLRLRSIDGPNGRIKHFNYNYKNKESDENDK